ncbi:unnamed protein product [Heterobilharzia americana]|nr:unnamed protein product [Heterobilharzia americana]
MRPHSNTANKVPGLQLHRVIRLGDKYDSQVLTFIVPSQLTRGFLQSVQSRDFYYGGHRWFIRMEYYKEPNEHGIGKEDSHFVQYRKQPLGVSIHLCSVSSGMTCRLKSVKFTIPHQEFYTQNLVQELEDIQFRCSNISHKISTWIESGLLTNERYLFDDSTCILEVELQDVLTTYEEQLRVPRDSKEAVRCKSLESTTFSFAGDDWSLIIDWSISPDKSRMQHKDDSRPRLFIQRHSSPKHWTRLRYGRVDLIPTAPQGGRNCARVEDPNGVDWIIMSDILGTYIRLKLFLPNESSVKYNDSESNMEVRSTAWSVQLIPYDTSLNIVKSMSPFYVIYTPASTSGQTTVPLNSKSPCQEVVLPLDVEKVCSSNFGYSRPNDNAITLRIEWLYSHVLCRGDYQNYDELVAMQRYNLIKDINIKVLEIDRLTRQKAVQFSISTEIMTTIRKNYLNQIHLVQSKRISQDNEAATNTKTGFTHSPTYCDNSQTNSPTIKNYLTPPVIINGSLDSNSNNENKHSSELSDDSLSSGSYWRRHSSCLEDVGSSKPRHRRQLPSPPSSSSSSRLVLPGGNSNASSNEYSVTMRPNSTSSPRLSLKQTNLEFGYTN